MKNPVTFSVYEARAVQRKRQVRQILLLSLLLLLLVGAVFFVYVINMKKEIDTAFPSGADISVAETAAATSASEPEATTDETSAASSDTTAPGETSGVDTDTTSPSATAEESVLIPDMTDLQKVSYKTRDARLHDLQQAVESKIAAAVGYRVGFYYINLSNNEAFGFNDSFPFVPGNAMNVAFSYCLYRQIEDNAASPDEMLTYQSEDADPSDSILSAAGEGKEYTLRAVSGLSLVDGNLAATNMLIRRQGGIDELNNAIRQISGIIDYRSSVTYTNYAAQTFAGKNRSSPQDLARYMEAFYDHYQTNPSVYQTMFNDLSRSTSSWGVGSGLPAGTLVCHRTGSNVNFGSETDVALIFSQEPYIVVVCAEGADQAAARQLQQDLGKMVYDYIASCYAG